jgi:hypothetical protein
MTGRPLKGVCMQTKAVKDSAFYADLHWRRHEGAECQNCGLVWPCPGATRQLISLRPWVQKFWLDEAKFAEMKAQAAADEAREARRRAERKAAAV